MKAIGTRLALRVGSLGLKFLLTIVVARTLGFDAVGAYGFAVAASVVASKVLGLGFSTELNRRLSADAPLGAIHSARRLFALYIAVYALLCMPLAIPGLKSGLLHMAALPNTPLWLVALVACAEHAALEVNSYVYSLHRPHAGSWLLFLRTGAWAGVAMAALMCHKIASIEALFGIWLATNVAVVAAGWFLIGRIARRLSAQHATNIVATGLAKVWADGLPFFIALLLLSLLQYLERFVAAGILTADELGRYVFAWSIANAIQTVAAATIVFTAAPRLVRAVTDRTDGFRHDLARALAASFALCGMAAIAIFLLREPIFRLAHEKGDALQTTELAILLLSFMLRSLADVLWAAAVALRSGRSVAIAMALLVLCCLPTASTLVHQFGALGAACAHLTASVVVIVVMTWIMAARMSSHRREMREVADAA